MKQFRYFNSTEKIITYISFGNDFLAPHDDLVLEIERDNKKENNWLRARLNNGEWKEIIGENKNSFENVLKTVGIK